MNKITSIVTNQIRKSKFNPTHTLVCFSADLNLASDRAPTMNSSRPQQYVTPHVNPAHIDSVKPPRRFENRWKALLNNIVEVNISEYTH